MTTYSDLVKIEGPFWKSNEYVIQVNGNTFVLGEYNRIKLTVRIVLDHDQMMKDKTMKSVSECKKMVEEFCRLEDPKPAWAIDRIGCGSLRIELVQIGWWRRFFALGTYHSKVSGVHLAYLNCKNYTEDKRFRTQERAVEYIEKKLGINRGGKNENQNKT